MKRFMMIGLALAISTINLQAQPTPSHSIGEKLPLESVCQNAKELNQNTLASKAKLKIFVFTPDSSSYREMLFVAFERYFLHLDPENYKNSDVAIFNVQNNTNDPSTKSKNLSLVDLSFWYQSCQPLTSLPASIADIHIKREPDADSTIIVVNDQDQIIWRDDHYRAQGEHLKPLEHKIKSALGIVTPVTQLPSIKPLKLQDIAPDFVVSTSEDTSYLNAIYHKSKVKLSDLKGKTVLLTFYPAAFSGFLPSSVSVDTQASRLLPTTPRNFEQLYVASQESCSGQILKLDVSKNKEHAKSHVVKIAITSSDPFILESWKEVLNTKEMVYTNDPDYRISQQYNSYDSKNGYNRRTVYIIDKHGRIAFIDDDYKYAHDEHIQTMLEQIDKQP